MRWFGKLSIGVGLVICLVLVWVGYSTYNLPKVLHTHPVLPAAILINNIQLISMRPGAPAIEQGRAILVVGDRIAAIGAADELTIPAGVTLIDGKGYTLLPGLIDAHIHLNDEAELAAYLAHGITGLRNMSGYPFHLPLAKIIASGELLAPDFITTGPMLNSKGPNQTLIQQTVTTEAEARAAVRAQYRAGYRTLKVYSNLSRDAFDGITDEANLLGMRLTGHSPEGVRGSGVPHQQPFDIAWQETLGRGFSSLEHIETIVWHGLRDNPTESGMRELAATLAASGEAVTPTLLAHKRLVLIAESQGAYLLRPGLDTINPLIRLMAQDSAKYWSQVDPSVYEGPRAEFYKTATRLLYEAGVPLMVGTDSGGFSIVPGASVTRELELLVEAGMSPYDALAAATRVSAEILGFRQTGIIAPGYRANLVLLAENPLDDISAVAHPIAVIIRGHLLQQAELEAMRAAATDTSLTRSAWRALQMRLAK
ncbi:hypothetical protein WG68_04985 [Arsukibacterium ikkense]|uniref:Amidohydrolase-related domain-containing protein n=1 Tax=Arsukibacterium ikkense TaxID=336831 RepID=A0A0M2VAJ2_9GAMM|nr:amidohydrolase family protein [Arsukibacterium ikkense]KKO46645.1 hypothetical protein WG68_04985 [Arsukibacterium ikkense]